MTIHQNIFNMDNGNTLSDNNVEYMLSAEFDNKLGSTINCQYPNDIPGLESFNLATLMIPDNMEKFPGKIDFTYFMLYFNSTAQCYKLLPPGDEIQKDIEIIYFINICNTILDSANDRGATIKAVALGSKSRDFIKWKPFLTVLLESMMNDTVGDDFKLLSTFIQRINKIDFSNIPTADLFQQIVQSINDSVDEETLIDNISQKLIESIHNQPDKYNNNIYISNKQIHYLLSKSTSPQLLSSLYYKLPINQNIFLESYIPTEIDYNRIALKLIRDINLQFTNTNEIKNIIVYSTKISKDYLCQLIFAVTYLVSGISIDKDPISKNICALPYVDISMMGLLKEYIQSTQELKIKLIAGTANPIFKIQEEVYDIFYDIDDEEIHASSKIKLKQSEWKRQTLNILTKSYKFNDNINSLSRGISNLSFKSKSGSTLLPPNSAVRGSSSNTSLISLTSSNSPPTLSSIGGHRVTLMTSFIQLLIWEHHDNRTIINVIKRIQILQLIPLVKLLKIAEINAITVIDVSEKYHKIYGDLVYFGDVFDEVNLKCIKLLSSLHEILEIVMDKNYFTTVKKTHDKVYAHISQLHDTLKQISELIDCKDNLRKLIYICMNFPSLNILSVFDITTKDFKDFDIKKFYSGTFFNYNKPRESKDFDWLKLISPGHDRNNYPVIDKFVANVGFNLLGKFLEFLPHINDKSKSATSSPLSSPSKKRNKLDISRSRSFRNLFSLKIHSEPNFKPMDYSKTVKDESQKGKKTAGSLLSPPSIPRQSSSYESISSSFSGVKQDKSLDLTLSHVLETRKNKIKSMIREIFRIIDDDTLGHILLWGYLDKDIKSHCVSKSNPMEKAKEKLDDDLVIPNMFTKPRELPIFALKSRNSESDTSIVSSLKNMDSIREKDEKTTNVVSSRKEAEEEEEEEEEVVFYDAKNL